MISGITRPYDSKQPIIKTTQMTLQMENNELVTAGLNPAAAHAAMMGSIYIRWLVILTWLLICNGLL